VLTVIAAAGAFTSAASAALEANEYSPGPAITGNLVAILLKSRLDVAVRGSGEAQNRVFPGG